jgi:hypothetical protein
MTVNTVKTLSKGLIVLLIAGQSLFLSAPAQAASQTVSLSVSGPKSAKPGSQVTFKFKLGKSVKGTCYVSLNGTNVGYSKFSGNSTQIRVRHANPGAYSFICAGGGTWLTDFTYLRVRNS